MFVVLTCQKWGDLLHSNRYITQKTSCGVQSPQKLDKHGPRVENSKAHGMGIMTSDFLTLLLYN